VADIRVSWLQLDTAAAPVDVRVSWLQLDTAAAAVDVRVSWLAFETDAKTTFRPFQGQRIRRAADVLDDEDDWLLLVVAALICGAGVVA
jgi:hypothetical protein